MPAAALGEEMIRLDSTFPEGYLARGYQFDVALTDHHRALELNPNSSRSCPCHML
tara:strand:- start:94 stop:258 length:165 start_codon:yes stop_codon:yes gene_type:complete